MLFGFTVEARKLEHGFRRISARIPILYLKGLRIMMFQLSGFYCRAFRVCGLGVGWVEVWGFGDCRFGLSALPTGFLGLVIVGAKP